MKKKMSINRSSFIGSLSTKNFLQYIAPSYEVLECLEESKQREKASQLFKLSNGERYLSIFCF